MFGCKDLALNRNANSTMTTLSATHQNLMSPSVCNNEFSPTVSEFSSPIRSFFFLNFLSTWHAMKSNLTIRPLQLHFPSVLLTLSQHSSSPHYKVPCLMSVREKGCCHTLFPLLSLFVSVSTESASKRQAH